MGVEYMTRILAWLRGREWERWIIPPQVEGKIMPFEEGLAILLREKDISGSVKAGTSHARKKGYAGAQRYRRNEKGLFDHYSDIAYRCGACQRIVIDRPVPVEETDIEKFTRIPFYIDYRCGSCDALMFRIVMEDFTRPPKNVV
ncbi:MAG: hypothetical protein KJ574_03025 [Nanoarchaeota archaeon]|nr:hypothetical protein [Nanoarchaeota archaeon]